MPFMLIKPLVLASASPRRQELLAQVGIYPEILSADGLDGFVEPSPALGEHPRAYVMRTAMAKAQTVAAHRPDAAVLAADTVVVLPEPGAPMVLGKPGSEAEALYMLKHLNGRRHEVLTACCIMAAHETCAGQAEPDIFCLATEVEFLHWPENVLAAYAHSGEGMDKAGAYAVQGKGAFLCATIRGSWSTVVGLPLGQVLERLCKHNIIQPTSPEEVIK